MAVIDQDNFSNISWHSEQNAESAASTAQVHHESNSSPEYARSGPDDGRPGDNAAGMEHDELDHSGGEILDCTVSDPHKENDGTKDAYVSYLITTNVRAISLHNTILALGHCHLRLLQADAPPTMGSHRLTYPSFTVISVDHFSFLPETQNHSTTTVHRFRFSLQGPMP